VPNSGRRRDITNAVFQLIGQVGMPRPEAFRDLAVVLRPLVGIFDLQCDRRSVVIPSKVPGQDFDHVGFLPAAW